MTDRIDALVIVLEHDMRDDDVESLVAAILHLRGVLSVKPHVVDDAVSISVARARMKSGLQRKIFEILNDL